MIESITDDNENPYINYEYTSHVDQEINAGDPPNTYFYGTGDDKAVLFNKYPMNIVFSGIYGSNWSTPKFGSYRGKAGIYTTNYHSTTMSGELYIQAGSSYYSNTMQLRKFINKAVRCIAK